MATAPLSIQDFAAKIREKHPGSYDDIPDAALTDKVLAKYPQYSDMVAKAPPKEAAPPQEPGLLSRAVDAGNRFAGSALSAAGLPKSIADIPDYLKHLIGQEQDHKPFWDDIHQAVKNPTQENLVKAVPFVGPTAVNMSQQAQQGNVAGVLGSVAGIAGGIAGGQQVAGGMAARGAAAADKAGISAASDLNKAIPATKSTPYTPEDLRKAQPYIDKEHTDSPITSVKEFRDSADAAIDKIEGQVRNAIEAVSANHATGTDFWPQTLADTKKVLSENARGAGFVKTGLKELEDFELGQPKTLFQQDAIRRQLNAENSATLRKNNYTVDIARKSDPGFAAREAAAESLRNSIYDALDKQGYDTGSLRHDEGSVIKLRNAAENQIFNAEKKVSGTANNALGKSLMGSLATAGGVGVGAIAGEMVGHPIIGGMIGERVGSRIANLFKADNLTRDALVERSFGTPRGNQTPFGPPPPPSGSATIAAMLQAKGVNQLQLNQQPQSPQLPFHPGAGLAKP